MTVFSIMYDGVNTDAKMIAKIIKPGDKVAYYIDGLFAWTAEEIALFPHNEHITITVLGNPADVADCETGDMTPDSTAAWIRKQRAAGYYRPTAYRSLALMQDLRTATAELVMGKDWDSWVADYDNSQDTVYAGSALKQYKSTSGYDESVIFDSTWPHRHLSASVAPVTNPKWPAGVVLQLDNKGNATLALQEAFAGSGIYGVRGIQRDGVFGEQTQTATKNFEASQGLTVDSGIAGSQVRSSLIRIGAMNSAGQSVH